MSVLDNLAIAAFGMTKQEALEEGVCLECKLPPRFYSEEGRNEYQISALCEPCFDNLGRLDD